MTPATLFRLSGIALILGAPLFAVGVVLEPADTVGQYADPLYMVANILKIIGLLLFLLGLPGMYVRQAVEAGRLGLVSFIMTFLGWAIFMSNYPLFTFMAPVLAEHPETQWLVGPGGTLEMQLGPLFLAYFFLGIVLLHLGLLFLGIATLRARVFPRWAAVLLIVTPIAGIVINNLWHPTEAVLAGIVFAWFGYELVRGVGTLSRRTKSAPQATQGAQG